MVYMRKLESTVGLIDLLTILCAAIPKAEGDHSTWVDEDGA
jgi:hypothetical protein